MAAAERWLGDVRSADAVNLAALRLRRSPEGLRIDRVAREAGLSERQFQRRFVRQVGMPPKLYARMVRFSALLGDKMANPRQTWTTLAHARGYFDQAHLLKDYHAFAHGCPSDFPFETAAVDPRPMSDPY